jgi:hypothetical protein
MMIRYTCGEFEYHGDASTLGSRWEEFLERFELHITVNQITNDEVAKASFLLLMGRESFRIYRAKRKRTDNNSLAQMKAIMSEHFVAKRSVYTEVTAFRHTLKLPEERVSDYAMRLRHLATHCKFRPSLETEIKRQFVVGCGMPEVQRKCNRHDDLDLNKVLDIAIGYEREAEDMTLDARPTTHYTSSAIRSGNPARRDQRPDKTVQGRVMERKTCG